MPSLRAIIFKAPSRGRGGVDGTSGEYVTYRSLQQSCLPRHLALRHAFPSARYPFSRSGLRLTGKRVSYGAYVQ